MKKKIGVGILSALVVVGMAFGANAITKGGFAKAGKSLLASVIGVFSSGPDSSYGYGYDGMGNVLPPVVANSNTTSSIVNTGDVTGIGAGAVTINASIAFVDGIKTRGFQFTKEIINSVPVYKMSIKGNGPFTTKTFMGVISGLECNTAYSYRAFASDEKGNIYGDDASFKTLACPKISTTPVSANVTNTSVVLNGRLLDTGNSSKVSVGFLYGKTTTYGSSTSVKISLSLKGDFSSSPIKYLPCGNSYHYTTYVDSPAGKIGGLTDNIFTTGSCKISAIKQ